MDKFLVTMFWILSVLGVGFLSHELGFLNGQDYQKSVNAKTLENCNRVLIGGIYE